MTKKVKKIIIWISLGCVVLAWAFYAHVNTVIQTHQGRAWSIERLISDFIRENDGHFPRNQQELINKGYIKVEYENDEPKYFKRVKSGAITEWVEWPVHLEWFKILYGFKKEDIIMVDDVLYNKTTNQRIFLLDGPYNRKIVPSLRNTYNFISLKWYNEMKNLSAEPTSE